MSSALCRTWPTTLARTRTGRVTHGLTRTDSRDTRAAHRVRQDPNGVKQGTDRSCAQATGESAELRAPRAGSQGEVGLVARSPPQQAKDLPTQLADLVTRLVVLGYLDVGDDARGAL